MIALDTNVLARLLLRDDVKQHAAAEKLLLQNRDYAVPITVVLELVWVLESVGFTAVVIADTLSRLIAQQNLHIQHADAVAAAIARYRIGADFADTLHHALCPAPEHTAFATFDKSFVAFAKKQKLSPSVAPIAS